MVKICKCDGGHYWEEGCTDEKKLKAYFWLPEKDSDSGVGIVAESSKEAKLFGWHYWGEEMGNDEDYISCRVNYRKEVKTDGLKKGFVEYKEGMIRGLYSSIEGEPCDICGDDDRLINVTADGKCICSDCDDKLDEVKS